VGVERCNLGMQILATRATKAESYQRWGRACGSGGGCRRCNLGMQADLGDPEGDEGKEPSSLEPRVGAVVGVERCSWRKQNLATSVTSGGGCREMQLGNANLGDKGNEGKGPSPLGPRVAAVVRGCREASCERCTGGANLGGGGNEGKAPSSLEPRVGAAVDVERCNLGM
jgi:hypothetical protein